MFWSDNRSGSESKGQRSWASCTRCVKTQLITTVYSDDLTSKGNNSGSKAERSPRESSLSANQMRSHVTDRWHVLYWGVNTYLWTASVRRNKVKPITDRSKKHVKHTHASIDRSCKRSVIDISALNTRSSRAESAEEHRRSILKQYMNICPDACTHNTNSFIFITCCRKATATAHINGWLTDSNLCKEKNWQRR